MVMLFMIMFAVLVMSTATLSYAQKAVPAGEIIAEVQNNQPVSYDGVIISGDLDLGRLNLAKVRCEFSIVNSTVKNASLNGVSFEKYVSFRGTTFSNASFNKTTFLESSDFGNASFHHASFVDA